MAMRLQEVHPAVVHFPITLLPVTIGADAIGRLTGSRTLLRIGRWGMTLTAGTAALAGFFGLIAQEEVVADGRAADLLVTHRTMNAGFIGLAAAMAMVRAMRRRPSLRYLLTGLGAIGAVSYSAYLGGKMVYDHGVGVRAAGGVRSGHGPELLAERSDEVTRHALEDARQGVMTAARDLRRGRIVPAFRSSEPVH